MTPAHTARPLLATLIAASLALPLAAQAEDSPQCRHSQPRDLALQLDGVRTVADLFRLALPDAGVQWAGAAAAHA